MVINDFKRWTRGESNAELFGDQYYEDPDAVDLNVLSACGDSGMLELIPNPNCRERRCFADLLVLSLCNIFDRGEICHFGFRGFLELKVLKYFFGRN